MSAPAPTLAEIITAMSAARAGSTSDDRSDLTKVVVAGVVTLIGGIVLGLFFWVGTNVSGLGTAVTKMSANVDQLSKSIGDLQTGQGLTAQQLSDGKATNARQDARMDAVDADINRMKERVRILEGQPPLFDQPDRSPVR